MCISQAAFGLSSDSSPVDVHQVLSKAEQIKRTDFDEFSKTLDAVSAQRTTLQPGDRDHLAYLQAWRLTYEGKFDQAIEDFKSLIGRPIDATLKSRATATLVNALAIGRRYDESFLYLTELLNQLPNITDKDVRSQTLGVAALLYNQVGQYELSIGYAERMLTESTTPWVLCGAAQFKFESMVKSGKLRDVTPELESWIRRCVDSKEYVFANLMRTYVAKLYDSNNRHQEAIDLLLRNREQVDETQYPVLKAEFSSVLALAYWHIGDAKNARLSALDAASLGMPNVLTEPLVNAYRVLFEIAEAQSDTKGALEYHKKYMAADKTYLDDVSARQLAFQMAQHQAVASKLQIETLNQQNQVLKLKEDLAAKAVQNSRLSIALLLTFLAFIALWAYKTKRSQLHFMRQAQHDSLTGIYNRSHFLQLSELALDHARRNQGKISIVIIDLDHFKIVNDAHGHAAGDVVLKRAVAACRQLLGPNDVFGRLGGEEFGLMLPDRDTVAAAEVAEQCRRAIAATNNGAGDDDFPISASFGVTSTVVSGFKLQQLLAQADSALYLAKRQGRNRVEVYKDGPLQAAAGAKELSAAS